MKTRNVDQSCIEHRNHMKSSIHARATAIIVLLLLFYWLLVAASLTPSPFEAGQGAPMLRYVLLSALTAYLAAWVSCRPARREEAASERSGSAGASVWLRAGRDALLIAAAIWLLLLAIQGLNQLFGVPAPMAATQPLVIAAVVGVGLLAAALVMHADRDA